MVRIFTRFVFHSLVSDTFGKDASHLFQTSEYFMGLGTLKKISPRFFELWIRFRTPAPDNNYRGVKKALSSPLSFQTFRDGIILTVLDPSRDQRWSNIHGFSLTRAHHS